MQPPPPQKKRPPPPKKNKNKTNTIFKIHATKIQTHTQAVCGILLSEILLKTIIKFVFIAR